VPPDGYYIVLVTATDTLGNQTPVLGTVASDFWIDRTAPPAPTITQKPTNPTTATTATFQFTDSESGVTFQCKLDGGAYSPCTSPKTYTGLSVATHTFSVVAVDSANNTSAPASYTWTVQGAGVPFTITARPPRRCTPARPAQ